MGCQGLLRVCPWASRIPELPPAPGPASLLCPHQNTNAEEAVLHLVIKDTEKQALTARSLANGCPPLLRFTLSE